MLGNEIHGDKSVNREMKDAKTLDCRVLCNFFVLHPNVEATRFIHDHPDEAVKIGA